MKNRGFGLFGLKVLESPYLRTTWVMVENFLSGIFDLDRGENHGTNPYGVKKVVKMA